MGDQVEVHHDKTKLPNVEIVSVIESQFFELAEVLHPSYDVKQLTESVDKLKSEIKPVYVYYPWRNIALETLPEKYFMELKTNRNQLLISKEDQTKLYQTSVSIAGMSVGGSLLFGLVGSGFAKNIVIADDDVFATSNLNRVQATALDIGTKKVLVAQQRAHEMNPFLEIVALSQRITSENMDDFFSHGATDIVFEEIDDFRMKLLIREEAKRRKIPVIMLTNLVDSVMIDVERYDVQPETKPFNGLVKSELLEQLRESQTIDVEMMKHLSVALVDKSLLTSEALETIDQIGITLVGRPQLYGTVALDGGLAPYLVRRIILENSLSSGRYSLKLGDIA